MSGLTAEQGCTCASVDGYRIKSRACPTHGPTMPPPRPAHEDPLRRTFTREQLDEAVEQARAEAWNEGEFAGREYQKRLYAYAHWSHIGVFPEPFLNPYAARIARGEVSP